MCSKKIYRRGFTLIELLMVIAIMAILMAIMIPISTDYQVRNDLDVAQTTFAQSVRRAQQLSMAADSDSGWGVAAVSGDIVVFKGATYATRDVTVDETFGIPTAIAISGQSEYNFAKMTGLPAQIGVVTFSNGDYQKTVGVNAKGIVNY